MSDVLDIVRAQRPERPALDDATRSALRARVTEELRVAAPANTEASAGPGRVRPEGVVDGAAIRSDGNHGRDRRWLPAAAASLVIVGVAGVWFAGTNRDDAGPSAPATQPDTSAIGTSNPGTATEPVPAGQAPARSSDPTSFPVLDNPPDGLTVTAYVNQIAQGASTPYAETLIGRRVDSVLTDAVNILVQDTPIGTSPAADHPPTDAVVFGQPATVIDRTSIRDDQVYVLWGSGPYFVASGEDPLAFLNQVDPDAISATPGSDATEAPQLEIGTLPDGFDVIVQPQTVGQATLTATLSIGTDNYDISVSTRNPAIHMAIAGPLQAIQVNGRPGWTFLSTFRYQGITWQVDDATYASLKVNDGTSNADALDLANRITFVDYDAWAARYLPETVTVTATTEPAPTDTAPDQTAANQTAPPLTEPRPSADSAEPVVVANASDTAGIAGATMRRLELDGYEVLDAVNAAAAVGTIDTSIVYSRPGHEALRDELAARLGIDATALLEPDAPLPIDGTNIDHDQVAVLIMLARGFALAPDPDTITHADFDAYVAQAREVFGDVSIGDPCDDWPDRTPAETTHLVVVPASNGDGSPCRVRGWAYNGLTPDDVPAGAIIVREDGVSPGPIFDANGNLVGHFDPPASSSV